MTFAELEYDSKKRRTRREIFLEKMEGLIPWQQLEDRIEPFYAKAGRGRRPYPLGVMLRVHCVQLFYNLSDPGMEDLLYEVESVRRFAGLRLSGPLPDETTILNFRHLLETQGLGMGLFEEINVHLASLGHRLKTGTIVDASIIDAPSSTKNRRGERDPEMHQRRSVRRFAGLRLSGPLPDETTILNFRHLLETQGLGMGLFEEINVHLASLGHRLKTGTIVDASIIDAPSSTKNRRGERDPEMHQTKKGNQWYFGMKAHIGVDAESGLAHSLATTAANAADVTQACVLLHGDETEAWGDAGYQGVDKRPENRGCGVAWQVAMKPGKRRLLDRDGAEAAAEKRKASVRAKVEHPFLYVKRRFGYGKVRYRGLAKNTQRIALLLGFSNLLIAGRYATG